MIEVEFINIEDGSTIDYWKNVSVYPKIGEHYEDELSTRYIIKDVIWIYKDYVQVILKR